MSDTKKPKYQRPVKAKSFQPEPDVLEIWNSIPDGERSVMVNLAIQRHYRHALRNMAKDKVTALKAELEKAEAHVRFLEER